MKRLLTGVAMLAAGTLLAGCGGGSTTIERETGYKGKARLDAYLAAERLLEHYGHEVESSPGWPQLDHDVAMVILPGSVLSTEAYVREISQWVAGGGHLLCLVEGAESHHDDWQKYGSFSRGEQLPDALGTWLKEASLEVTYGHDPKPRAERLEVDGESYEVFAESATGVAAGAKGAATFSQTPYGEGIISVMTDARPLRNRYISDHEHAALLMALVDQSPFGGKIVVVRDAALSLWTLLWRHGWPALAGLLAVTVFWLWKNMPRFGPMRRADPPNTLRDYDQHLEALGDFQWRLDKGAAMLRPLRESVLERAQRMSAAGHREVDLFAWIAERSAITRERAERAMTHERPGDATSFTRVLADLQKIHLSLS